MYFERIEGEKLVRYYGWSGEGYNIAESVEDFNYWDIMGVRDHKADVKKMALKRPINGSSWEYIEIYVTDEIVALLEERGRIPKGD